VRQPARRWHADLPGSEYAVIPDAGHVAHQDNPEGFNRVLRAFQEEWPAGGIEREITTLLMVKPGLQISQIPAAMKAAWLRGHAAPLLQGQT